MKSFYQQSLSQSLAKNPNATAVISKSARYSYADLDSRCKHFANALASAGFQPGDRVGIYLPKQIETLVSILGSNLFGAVFVIINPALKADQVDYIVRHCDIKLMVSHEHRIQALNAETLACLSCLVSTDGSSGIAWEQFSAGIALGLVSNRSESSNPKPPAELASIIYTSGSTGQPKGVMISNDNLVAGARSVASYLQLSAKDNLLAVLPLSFDYGLNQITSALFVGASVTLLDYLLPKDILTVCEKEGITGLAAVPPLWLKLSRLKWPEKVKNQLRYLTTSGGVMPESVIKALAKELPKTKIFLMYGLTEAFRSTYLAPEKAMAKPASIGQAIPEATVLIVDKQGHPVAPLEQGELIHLGPHVSLGYWNDPEKTRMRFRNLPHLDGIAVFSGDSAYCDEEGDIFFVSRDDEMIKSSGYRISPYEIESVIGSHDNVDEVVACGVADKTLGQAIYAAISTKGDFSLSDLTAYVKKKLPQFQHPKSIFVWDELPKNANGKLDRSGIISAIRHQAQDSLNVK